jgi:hypothetical protein
VDGAADLLVKTAQGILLELKLLLPVERAGKATRTFATPDYKPDKKRFILCVEFDQEDAPIAWVFPSMVFWAYSGEPTKTGLRKLNLALKSKEYFYEPLWDYLRGFRDRWGLITDFKYYRRFMSSPEGFENLEDILLLLIAVERRDVEDEPIPFKPFPSEPIDALPDGVQEPASRAGPGRISRNGYTEDTRGDHSSAVRPSPRRLNKIARTGSGSPNSGWPLPDNLLH